MPPGICMVELLEAPRFSYGWILRGPPVFIWLDFYTLSSSRMVELLGAPRFTYGWTLKGTPVFKWLHSQKPPGAVWLDS